MCGEAAGNAAEFRVVVFGGVIVWRDLRGIVDFFRLFLGDTILRISKDTRLCIVAAQ